MGSMQIGRISLAVALVRALLSIAPPRVLSLNPAYLGFSKGASLDRRPQRTPPAGRPGELRCHW
jgi:hypothetical protein